MQHNPRFDDFLFTIVKETGGLEGFLNSVFSFLSRRTDFSYESDPGDKMGFPPGVSTRMLLSIADQYQREHYKKYPKKDPADYQAKLKKFQEAKEAKEKKPQEEVKTQTEQPQAQAQTKIQEEKPATKTVPTTQAVPQQKEKVEEEEVPTTTAPKSENIDTSISTYNGASTDKYNWSQGINEVTVQVKIPSGTRAKGLNVDMTSTKLKVVLKSENRTLIEGEWYERIKVDDSTWSVDDDSLVLNLEKGSENIWKTVLKGDQEIDATKVDNSKPIDAFDSETQGALRKIMVEQQRKQMGLPSLEEEAQHEMLKKAWNAEGSPFKGQPFDPSKFNLGGNAPMNFDGDMQ
jgi:hypothetical protein